MGQRTAYVVLCSLIGSAPLAAQDTLHFDSGALLEDAIPYGENLVIVGETRLPRGNADVVRIEATGEWIGTERAVGCWVRPLDGDGPELDNTISTFAVRLNARARLDRPYDFEMRFYERTDAPSWQVPVQGTVQDVLRARDEGETVDAAFLNESFRDRLHASLPPDRTLEALDLRVLGRCPDMELQTQFELSEDVREMIFQAADAFREMNDIGAATDEVRDRLAPLGGAFDPLQEALDEPLPDLPYTQAELDAVRAVVDDDEGVPTEAMLATFGGLARDDTLALRVTGSRAAADALAAAMDALEAVRRLQTSSVDQLRTHAESLEALADSAVTEAAGEIFALTGTARLGDQVSWADSATVERLQIGTSFATGFAWLGSDASEGNPPFGGRQTDFFSSVLVKIRPFGVVDTRLPSSLAYHGDLARLSIHVGAALNLQYQGTDLANSIVGVKPMLGLSWDLTTRIDLHAGFVFFQQNSVNPLTSTETSGDKVGFYLMSGFDFDVLNRVTTLAGS